MYIQTEFCLDLSQGNTDSMPSWMKGLSDRATSKTQPLKAIQLSLFDTSVYAN